MSDDPGRQTRAAAIETRIMQLREMWLAGGYHPERLEDQAEWGELIRDLREANEQRTRRRERMAKWAASLAIAVATAAAPILLPLLVRLLGWPR